MHVHILHVYAGVQADAHTFFLLLSKWSHLLCQIGIGDYWLELNNFLHYHTRTAD
jgi:hypothetical protein